MWDEVNVVKLKVDGLLERGLINGLHFETNILFSLLFSPSLTQFKVVL